MHAFVFPIDIFGLVLYHILKVNIVNVTSILIEYNVSVVQLYKNCLPVQKSCKLDFALSIVYKSGVGRVGHLVHS